MTFNFMMNKIDISQNRQTILSRFYYFICFKNAWIISNTVFIGGIVKKQKQTFENCSGIFFLLKYSKPKKNFEKSLELINTNYNSSLSSEFEKDS